MMRWLVALGALAAGYAGVRTDEVTYHGHIAPIIARRCLPCHNANEAGAFPLTNFSEVRRRASLIRWVTLAGNMPPTKVESELHPMTSGYLADDERIQIQEWVRTGMREGTPGAEVTPPELTWRIATPDATLRTTEQVNVAAEGPPYRRVFTLDPKLTEPRQLRAFDLRPDSPFAVRQAVVSVVRKSDDPTAETKLFRRTGLETSALIGAWAPGYPHWQSDVGLRLDPGDRIAVAVLYQPTGRAVPAGFELGLRWSEASDRSVRWVRLGRAEGVIAPGDGVQTFSDETEVRSDTKLRAVIPECREFARQVRVFVISPAGKQTALFRINAWDVNWVGAYQWPSAISLPAGSRVRVEIDYDNSGHSAGGRELLPIDPVKLGPGMDEELFWAHLQFED